MPVEIYSLHTRAADAWVAWDGVEDNNYAYGGARMVTWRTPNEQAIAVLHSLMQYESSWKNTLINAAVAAGAVDDLAERLPPGFLTSRVGGARCVMRPHDEAVAAVMSEPTHPEFETTIEMLFAPLGELLNDREGRVKLTPDFGKFAGMADVLHRHTSHVLGVSREKGGCGGKSTYSATGIVAAYDALVAADIVDTSRVTLVGAAGAMGETVAENLLARGDREVTVCDLKYEDGTNVPPSGATHTVSAPGMFTDDVLTSSDVTIAATWGGELVNSRHDLIEPEKILLLAHNLAIPSGVDGLELTRGLSRPGVLVIPGQILTLGGALTSRLEWFSRSSGIATFDKPLAHEVVGRVVTHWVMRLAEQALEGNNPYEALLEVCDGPGRSVA
jgi:hypothetical protein